MEAGDSGVERPGLSPAAALGSKPPATAGIESTRPEQ